MAKNITINRNNNNNNNKTKNDKENSLESYTERCKHQQHMKYQNTHKL